MERVVLNALVTRLGRLIFAPSATRQPSSRRGGTIHHNNRYAFLRYAMRSCSRASLPRHAYIVDDVPHAGSATPATAIQLYVTDWASVAE